MDCKYAILLTNTVKTYLVLPISASHTWVTCFNEASSAKPNKTLILSRARKVLVPQWPGEQLLESDE